MTSITQAQSERPTWTTAQRLCAAWIIAMFLIAFGCGMDTGNVMVMDRYVDIHLRWTIVGATLTAACGTALAWRVHQKHNLPHFGRMVTGYVLMMLVCGFIGAVAVYGSAPRVSLLMSKSEMTIEADLYKVSSGAVNRRTERNPLQSWGWLIRHPNNEIYDLALDPHLTSPLISRHVSVPDRQGQPLLPTGRGGWAVPKPILLHGTGNTFAIRVTDFTVLP